MQKNPYGTLLSRADGIFANIIFGFLVDIYPLCDYYEWYMAFGVYFAATWKRYTPFHPSACLTIVLTGRPMYVLCVKLTLEQADTPYAYVRNNWQAAHVICRRTRSLRTSYPGCNTAVLLRIHLSSLLVKSSLQYSTVRSSETGTIFRL